MKKTIIYKLPAFTLISPALMTPRSIGGMPNPKYVATAMYDEKASLWELCDIVKTIGIDAFNSIVFTHPFRKNKDGKLYVSASSPTKPLLKEALPDDCEYIADNNTFYTGARCTAEITFFTYDSYGRQGVGLQLLSVTKLANNPLTSVQIETLVSEAIYP